MMAAPEPNALILAGRYRLIAEIGRGGMADVYLALNRTSMGGFQKLLVIKLLRSNLALEDEFLKMFLDEARLAARLNHPNVVQTNEVGEDSGRYFIAMEYLEGQTLHRIIKHREAAARFPRLMRVHALTRILAGLQYAHDLVDYDGRGLGVVHRDVSPSNIILTYEGQAKLMDFGIAKARDSTGETRTGEFKGKTGYIAPEQIGNDPDIDRRADVYAMGVVLWEMLVGERMWKGVAPMEVLRRTAAGDLPSLRVSAPDVPVELERICLKALATNRDERYSTAAAMEVDLEAYLGGHTARPADRDIGNAVKSMYAEDRVRLRNAIEAQLKRPDGALEGALPVISGGVGGATGTSSVSGVESIESSKGRLAAAFATSGPVVESPLWITPAPRRQFNFSVAVGAMAIALCAATAALVGYARWAKPSSSTTASGAPPGAEATGPVRGVSDSEVLLGMSAAFSGPARELGTRMKLGIDTAFDALNERGGVANRKIRLVALDDGYEGARAGANMKELLGSRGVLAVVGNVGTPTAQIAAPFAVANKTLFFGAFTGAKILRQEPPDRYVFNYRASYEEETATMVHYLVDARKISPAAIVVFAQHDGYGDAGFEGVVKTLRKYGRSDSDVLRVNYERNTVDVDGAVRAVVKYHQSHAVSAIIMVATYKPAARFIQKVKDSHLEPLLLNVSFVGSNALADELREAGPGYAPGVIVTQVVPHYESNGTGVLRYREAFKKFHPDQQPDFISLEGYIVGSLFAEGLRRAGRDLTTEKLVDALETIHDYDVGIGSVLGFGMSQHQASHKVWGTVLDGEGHAVPLDME